MHLLYVYYIYIHISLHIYIYVASPHEVPPRPCSQRVLDLEDGQIPAKLGDPTLVMVVMVCVCVYPPVLYGIYIYIYMDGWIIY